MSIYFIKILENVSCEYDIPVCSYAEISSETNDRDGSRFLDVPPVVYSGCWAGTWRRQLVVAFEAVTSGKKGGCFRSSGGK